LYSEEPNHYQCTKKCKFVSLDDPYRY
jgi:hypothetical protein